MSRFASAEPVSCRLVYSALLPSAWVVLAVVDDDAHVLDRVAGDEAGLQHAGIGDPVYRADLIGIHGARQVHLDDDHRGLRVAGLRVVAGVADQQLDLEPPRQQPDRVLGLVRIGVLGPGLLVLGQRPQLPPAPNSGTPLPVVNEWMRLNDIAVRYDKLLEQAVATSVPILNQNRLYTLTGHRVR